MPLVPGASLTALLSGGDLVLGAVGTVTYVDGPTVLGFGHPFTGAGPSRFLMGDGYVFQTIAAPITGSSYKLAEPGTLQGMIVGDRTDGVTGRLGPVEGIAGTATAENASRGTTSTVAHHHRARRPHRADHRGAAPGRARDPRHRRPGARDHVAAGRRSRARR